MKHQRHILLKPDHVVQHKSQLHELASQSWHRFIPSRILCDLAPLVQVREQRFRRQISRITLRCAMLLFPVKTQRLPSFSVRKSAIQRVRFLRLRCPLQEVLNVSQRSMICCVEIVVQGRRLAQTALHLLQRDRARRLALVQSLLFHMEHV